MFGQGIEAESPLVEPGGPEQRQDKQCPGNQQQRQGHQPAGDEDTARRQRVGKAAPQRSARATLARNIGIVARGDQGHHARQGKYRHQQERREIHHWCKGEKHRHVRKRRAEPGQPRPVGQLGDDPGSPPVARQTRQRWTTTQKRRSGGHSACQSMSGRNRSRAARRTICNRLSPGRLIAAVPPTFFASVSPTPGWRCATPGRKARRATPPAASDILPETDHAYPPCTSGRTRAPTACASERQSASRRASRAASFFALSRRKAIALR